MSSVDFLFTPPVQRVLAATLTQPNRAFTLQELLRRAAVGRGSTQAQIERLVKAGVLAEGPRQGRQRSIRANTNFFLYDELRRIAMKSFALTEPIQHALKPFAAQITEAFIFGSVAKGSDTGQSDIDLVIVGTAPQLPLYEAASKLELDVGRPLNISLYEPAEWDALVRDDPIVRQINEGPRLQLFPADRSKPNSANECSRALGVARLVVQVQAMVEESGKQEGFNAAEWVAQWLEKPLPALDGRRPAEFMDTAEGQKMVAGLVARMQSAAYA